MGEKSTLGSDLFGDPIPANHGRRGRPAHIPTAENRNKVMMLLALGWSTERIASALGVTLPTLRKHYKFQLKARDAQRDRMDAAYAMRLWRQVSDGNVGAMRLWQQFLERNDAAVGIADFNEKAAAEPAPPRLGKKELAAQAAATAGEGTAWGELLKPLH